MVLRLVARLQSNAAAADLIAVAKDAADRARSACRMAFTCSVLWWTVVALFTERETGAQ